ERDLGLYAPLFRTFGLVVVAGRRTWLRWATAQSCSWWYDVTMHRALVALVAVAVALVFVAAVFASDPTKEKIARTPAGNAEAASLVLKKHDLPAGWAGGTAKPDLSSSLGCSSYKPKQSDLVLIGAAETRWEKGTTRLDSQTEVLRTPR